MFLLPLDGLLKVPTTASLQFVNQLDTARRFMWNEVTSALSPCGFKQHRTTFFTGGILMVFIGIDVAKDKHDCFIINSDGEVLCDVFTVSNTLDGFNMLFDKIKSVSPDLSKTKVGFEATGHYSYNLLGFLLNKGLATYVLNPLYTSLCRKSASLRKTKTDKVDARTIAGIIMSDVNLKPYSNTLYHNQELKSLTRYRFSKISERTKLRISVSRLVNILFPELEKLVPRIHMTSIYALLSEFPSAKHIANANLTRLTNLLRTASRGRYKKDTAIRFRDAARSSIGSVMPAKSLELKHTIKLIGELSSEIKEIDNEIKHIVDDMGTTILTIPGINYTTAASILAEVGDFSNFESPDKVLAFAGMSPSTYQSGRLTNCHAHMEKRGSKYLRYALYNAARCVCGWDSVFSAYLAKKRSEGKHYNVALSHAVKKLVRVIFALERSRLPYMPPA